MKFQPVFPSTIATGQCRVAVANTATDGSGTITPLFTAGANGARVDKVLAVSSSPIGVASSTMTVSLFISSDSGVTYLFIGSTAFATATPSATVIGKNLNVVFVTTPIYLAPNQILGVAQSKYVDSRDQIDWTVFQAYNF